MTVTTASGSRDLALRLRNCVIPAVPTPCTAGGVLDEPALGAYARWMIAQQVGAVAVWAHTGRGLLLGDDDRARILAVWRAAAGAVPLVCGVGVSRGTVLPADRSRRTDAVIAATVAMAAEAARGGAAGLLVHPPTALRDACDADERAVELHRAVAAVGLPVLAFYLYEAAGGVPYRVATIERLLAIDGVIGIKLATLDSVMTYQDLVPVVRGVPGALLVTGEDRFFGYSLMAGADAALVGIASACTDATVATMRAWCAPDPAAFIRASARLDAFAAATFAAPMEGYVQRLLWALTTDGVLTGDPRDPHAPPLPREERERVARAVRALRAT